MQNLAFLPRILGALYFYSPEHNINEATLNNLAGLLDAYSWQQPLEVQTLIDSMDAQRDTANRYTFSVLFEGQGEMIAPPWGSVYLHKDNLIMGDSTAEYCQFLDRVGVSFDIQNQPLDQFGLMLWTLAILLEEGNDPAIVELLGKHMLIWSTRYLTLLSGNTVSPFYANLAKLTSLFLLQLQNEIGLHVPTVTLFK